MVRVGARMHVYNHPIKRLPVLTVPVPALVRNRSVKIAKMDQHDGIAAGFGITAAILKIVLKSQELARYGTEKNVSQMCGTKMNTHA